MTQGERLARIEALLDGWLATRKDDRAEWADELKKIHERLEAIDKKADATNGRLNAYENKGKGLILGWTLAVGGLIGGAITLWDKLKGLMVH